MNEIQEAVHFFKSEKAYHKLFRHIRKKYASLGRIGGTVPVKVFTEEELAVISRFFGMSHERLAAKPSISIPQFDQQLQNTRYGGIGLEMILEAFFEEKLVSKKQLRNEREGKQRKIIEELIEREPVLHFWFSYLLENPETNRWVFRLAEAEEMRFAERAAKLARAITGLPRDSAERLPVFAQRVTGDPHAFDLNEHLGKLLLHILSVIRGKEEKGTGILPSSTEEMNELLQYFNIYRDDLLNFATCSGLLAETLDGSSHPLWQAAVQSQAVLNMPLREIASVDRVYPHVGKKVWLVENSGVCASIIDQVPCAPIVSTNGQFKLATLMLLDKLVREGCQLYYAGDFDPEGLQMAQRLRERYPGHVHLWFMNADAYQKSEPAKPLEDNRLEKLRNISDVQLRDTAEKMIQIKKAGYQEALLDRMIADIKDVI